MRSPSQAENHIKLEDNQQTPSQQIWNTPTNHHSKIKREDETDTDDAQSTPAIGYLTPSEFTSPNNEYTPDTQLQTDSFTPGSHHFFTPKQEPMEFSSHRIKQEEPMEEPMEEPRVSSSPTPSTRPRFSFEPEDAEEYPKIKQEEEEQQNFPILPQVPPLPAATAAAFAIYPTVAESPATTVDSDQLLHENHFGFGSPMQGEDDQEEEDDEYALNPMVLPPLRDMSLSRHGSLLESQRQISTQIHVVRNSASPRSSPSAHSLLSTDHHGSASSSTDDFARRSVSERRRSLMDEWKRNSLQGALPAPDLLQESAGLNRESEWSDTEEDYNGEDERSPTIKTEDEDEDPDATFQRPSPSSPVSSPVTSPAPMVLATSTPTTARVSSTSSPLINTGVHKKIPKSLSAMFATAVAYAAAIKSTKSPKSAVKTPVVVSPGSMSPPVNPERASTVFASSNDNSQTSLPQEPKQTRLTSPLPAPSPYVHKHVDSMATDFVFEPTDEGSMASQTPRLDNYQDQDQDDGHHHHHSSHNIATAITTPSITDIPGIMGTPQIPANVKQEPVDENNHIYNQVNSPPLGHSSPLEPRIKTEPVDEDNHIYNKVNSPQPLGLSSPLEPRIKTEPVDSSSPVVHGVVSEPAVVTSTPSPPPQPIKRERVSMLLSPDVFFSEPLTSPSVTSPSSFTSPNSPHNNHYTSEEEDSGEYQDDNYDNGINGTPTYKRTLVSSESQHRLWSPATPHSPALDSEISGDNTTEFLGPNGLETTSHILPDVMDSPTSASPHLRHSFLGSPEVSERRHHRPWAPVYVPGTQMAIDEEKEIKQEEDDDGVPEKQVFVPVVESVQESENEEYKPFGLAERDFESPLRKRRYTPWAPEAASPSKLAADDSFAAAARLPVELPVDYPDIHAGERYPEGSEDEEVGLNDQAVPEVQEPQDSDNEELPVEPVTDIPDIDAQVPETLAEPVSEIHVAVPEPPVEASVLAVTSTSVEVPAPIDVSVPVEVSVPSGVSTPVEASTPVNISTPVKVTTSISSSTPVKVSSSVASPRPASPLSPVQSSTNHTPIRSPLIQSPAKTPETCTPEQSIMESPEHLSVCPQGTQFPAQEPAVHSPSDAIALTPIKQEQLPFLEKSHIASPSLPSTPRTPIQTQLASPFDQSPSQFTNEKVLASPTVEIKRELRDNSTPTVTEQTPSLLSKEPSPIDDTIPAEAPANNSWDDIAPALAASLTFTLADEEEQARAATPTETKYEYKSLDPGSPAKNSKFGIPDEPAANSSALLSKPLVHRRSRSAGDVDRVLFENQVAASLGSVLDFNFDGSSENLPLPPAAPFAMDSRPVSFPASASVAGSSESIVSFTTDENGSVYRTPDEQSEVSDQSEAALSVSHQDDYDYENEATVEEPPEASVPETLQTLLPKHVDTPSTTIFSSPPTSSLSSPGNEDESTTSPVSPDRPATIIDDSSSAAAVASAATTTSAATTASLEPRSPVPLSQLPDLAEYSLSLGSSMSEFPIFDATNSAAATEALLSAQPSASGKAIFFPHHGRGFSADLPVIEPLKIETTTATSHKSPLATSSITQQTVSEEEEEEVDNDGDDDDNGDDKYQVPIPVIFHEKPDEQLPELHLPVPEIVFTPAPESDTQSISDTVSSFPVIKQDEEHYVEPYVEPKVETSFEPQVKQEEEFVYETTPEHVIKQEEHEPVIKQEDELPVVDLVPVDEVVQTEQNPVDEVVQTEQQQENAGNELPPNLSVIKEESHEFSPSETNLAAPASPSALMHEASVPAPENGLITQPKNGVFPPTPLDALPTSKSGSVTTSVSQELSAVMDQVSIKQEAMTYDRKYSVAESAHSDNSYDTQPLNIYKRSSQQSSVGELGYKDADAYDAMLPDAHASNEDDGFSEDEDEEEEEEEIQGEPSIVAADTSLKVRRSLAPDDVARFSFSSKMLRESSKASVLSHGRKASMPFANEEPFPSYFQESSLTDPSNYPLAAAAATAAAISSPYTPRARAFSGQSAHSAISFSGNRYPPILGTSVTLHPSSAAGATAGTSTGVSTAGGRSFSSASHNESLGLAPPVVSKKQDELAPPLLLFDIDDVAFDSESIFNDLNKEFDKMLQSEDVRIILFC